MTYLVHILLLCLLLAMPAAAQEGTSPDIDRSATGGAQTLEDILARQRGEATDRPNRAVEDDGGAAAQAQALVGALRSQGSASAAELWEGLRFGTANVSVSSGGPEAAVLIQDAGMAWLSFREGPLRTYGGYALLGTIGLLVLFYVLRGRIRIDGDPSGTTILRFTTIERFAHWLLAGSFILLGITGLVTLFGRLMIPYIGHEAFAPLAVASKWIHNNVAWPFMLALVMVFIFWVLHNIPNRHDLVWLAKGGGLFSKGVHPPARKFNAGQKIIFWAVILLGGSISASGLSLLFPFELPMFAATFAKINATGLPAALGMAPLPEVLAPHQEMQLSQAWHAIVSFALMAIIIAHIYIGSVGMEGAYDAMGSGEVDLQWAREHHGLWVEEVQAKEAPDAKATPAE
ncbi:MAG: formate dehydrogenase subunit gamma [Pseudomonadota bacterium]